MPRSLNPQRSLSTLKKNELILLGHLLGDGSILPNRPYRYASADPENVEVVVAAAKDLFGIQARVVRQDNHFQTFFSCPFHLTHGVYHPITEWFQKLNIQRVRSYEKVVPSAVFLCSEEDRLLFLKHLWATDGNISAKIIRERKPSCSIYYASSSYLLASQVQHLLLASSIQSSLRTSASKKQYRPMYHVQVEGSPNQKSFLTRVGCNGERGKSIPLFLNDLNQITPNPNNDTIPKEAWQLIVKDVKDRAKLGWRDVCKGLNTSYCGNTLFKSGISRERMLRLYNFLKGKELLSLAESDIYWDEILSITEVGIEDVYDATVPGVHNFVANDFVVHNSIEQDSDVVMFLLRRDYYDPYDKPGMAEVIIAKNRHGAIGNVNLTFRKEIGQFANYTPINGQGDVANVNKAAFSAFSPDGD